MLNILITVSFKFYIEFFMENVFKFVCEQQSMGAIMRVKLKVRTYEKGGKTYKSYSITLPKSLVEAINLSESEEVEVSIKVIDNKQAIVITKP